MADANSPHPNDKSENQFPPSLQGSNIQPAAGLNLPQLCDRSSFRILRLPEVMDRVGLKHSSIYQYIARGSFPKQITLGGHAVGWLEHEIDEWLATRIHERHAPS